jgi:histidinol phosphatase-like PHP family hydrolase
MSSPICDYHIHYFVDGCAHDEMTLANIEREAIKLDIKEICVLKHYSQELPNGNDLWVNWKKIILKQFTSFVKEVRDFQSTSKVLMLAGVETEIVDDSGKINISEKDVDSLDAIILSVHWLPRMKIIDTDSQLIPGQFEKSPSEVVAHWRKKVQKCGVESIVRNFVSSYVKAIELNPKVRILAHMFDGLYPLRNYGISVDNLSDHKLNLLMEPLMVSCAENQVLWELSDQPVRRPSILRRANDIGVLFSATSDAHSLASLREHFKAEKYISSLGLTKGTIKKR